MESLICIFLLIYFIFFYKRGGSKHSFPITYPPVFTNFDQNGDWLDITKFQYQHETSRPMKSSYLMIPLLKTPESAIITVIGKEMDWINWIFACRNEKTGNKINRW